MRESIYISGLGDRNVLTEHQQIIWFWEQYCKNYTRKAHVTKFWLDIAERYTDYFNKIGAFELLDFIRTKVSDRRVSDRLAHRVFQEAKRAVEFQELMEKSKDWQKKQG